MIRLCIFLLSLLSIGFAQAPLTVVVWEDKGIEGLNQLVQNELNTIAKGRLNIRYAQQTWPDQPQGEYDLLITLGPRTSQFMASQSAYPTPVIIGTVLDPDIQQLPKNQTGGSGKQNLNYITSPFDTEKDLAQFRKIRAFQHLAILIDKELAELVPGENQVLSGLAQGNEETSLLTLQGESSEEVLAMLPPDCDAVYLLPLGQMYEGEELEVSCYGAVSSHPFVFWV